MSVEEIVKRLQRIAKLNKDEFRYHIDIYSRGISVNYKFVCTETADGHEFVEGVGSTVEEAIETANVDINDACEQWGYKQ